MKESAGILLYRMAPEGIEVLLAHPGGPFWQKRDAGAWSIPKGEFDGDEDPEIAARREFLEETGFDPTGPLLALGTARQNRQKRVTAFALEGDFDPAGLKSNRWSGEWPPGSGRMASFPEIDRVAWFTPAEARRNIVAGQSVFLDRLEAAVSAQGRSPFSAG